MSRGTSAGGVELHAVVGQAAFGVAVTDGTGRVVDVNSAYCASTGYARTELLGRDLSATIHPDDRAASAEEVRRVLRGEPSPVAGERRHVRKDGHHVWLRTALSLVRDDAGAPAGVVALTMDVTADRAAREVRVAVEALGDVSRALTGAPELEPLLLRLTNAATRLTGAAVGVLFFAGAGSGGRATRYAIVDARRDVAEVRPVDAAIAPADDTVSPLVRAIPEADAFVRCLALPVSARGRSLGRLVLGQPGLAGFTDEQERTVAALAAQAALALEHAGLVEDRTPAPASTGEAPMSREEFLSKLSHELRTPLNAILGWAVMMNSGTLDDAARARAASTIERNARNQLQLIEDLLDAPGAAEAGRRLGMEAGAMNLSRLHGLRVLVVDDQPEGVEAFVPTLTRRGADVRVASSADEAMKIFHDWTPGVLVTDIAMPGQDGYALLRRIRALPAAQGGGVPAVALTALGGARERKRALAAGFQRHLPKPVDRMELALVIASLAGIAEQPV